VERECRATPGDVIGINCSAIVDTLLESELFGHEKGSFTGATGLKPGKFELAEDGTIFLDEIGELPLLLQAKLLRVLQERQVQPLGSTQVKKVDVRVVAATHRDLAAEVKAGRFREDLYYRLNVIPIQLPTLRERREDIPLLVANFLKNKFSPRNGHPIQITRRAVETLNAHSWPGNVRELENVLERACTLCETDLVRVADLPPAVQASAPEASRVPPGGRDETEFVMAEDAADRAPFPLPPATGAKPPPSAVATGSVALEPLKDFLREQELNYLNRTLTYTGGNKEKAAELLGISLATLYRKLAGDPAG